MPPIGTSLVSWSTMLEEQFSWQCKKCDELYIVNVHGSTKVFHQNDTPKYSKERLVETFILSLARYPPHNQLQIRYENWLN